MIELATQVLCSTAVGFLHESLQYNLPLFCIRIGNSNWVNKLDQGGILTSRELATPRYPVPLWVAWSSPRAGSQSKVSIRALSLPAPGPLVGLDYLPGTHTLGRGCAATLTAARELLAPSALVLVSKEFQNFLPR